METVKFSHSPMNNICLINISNMQGFGNPWVMINEFYPKNMNFHKKWFKFRCSSFLSWLKSIFNKETSHLHQYTMTMDEHIFNCLWYHYYNTADKTKSFGTCKIFSKPETSFCLYNIIYLLAGYVRYIEIFSPSRALSLLGLM